MIIAGVATLPERADFFMDVCRPGLEGLTDKLHVYHDAYDWGELDHNTFPFLGDAGKFLGLEIDNGREDFYYFSCDDDLEYTPAHFQELIKWIEKFDRKVVVSTHGSTFNKFPINSYYKDKKGVSCLRRNDRPVQVLFPGTGVMAFHSSLFTREERKNFLRNFPHPNMADIWMGILLQKKKIPAVIIPHNGDLVKYDQSLKLADTIWGKHFNDDFIQTAVVNQFSLSQGFHLFPVPPLGH